MLAFVQKLAKLGKSHIHGLPFLILSFVKLQTYLYQRNENKHMHRMIVE